MSATGKVQAGLTPETAGFYRHVMQILRRENVPFMVGGAYALARYTGIVRHTKDFDVFLRPDDAPRALAALAAAGYRIEMTFPHWLGKTFHGDDFCDIIFSSGNGLCRVDDAWFEHAAAGTFLGEEVLLCPVEEMIWSKGYVIERERYDGADICHLLRTRGAALDWWRLLERFGPHWRVLLSHLILFGFVYPAERDQVPAAVMGELLRRLREEAEAPAPADRVCHGTLLSREQYLKDIQEWGYRDPRLEPEGTMSARDVHRWTAAANGQK
jgi:hypothetical protein